MAAMADSKTNHGGHDSRAIANCFVRLAHEAGKRLTIMPLVKYVYIAHGWTLGHTGEPLICHEVQAWKHGPVVPEVYYAFRSRGFIVRAPAKNILGKEYHVDLDGIRKEIVGDVYAKYSALTPFQLSSITHHPHSPWSKYRGHYYEPIPDEEIARYYREVVAKLKRGDV